MEKNKYNPDVLNCIANLSSDEVFTPPQLANEMLDLLPQELFRNPKSRFLDPFSKSGVFLREIVKRLDIGLSSIIPDRKERILHILHNQVFGIALTELTAMLTRRSVYCSKTADSDNSVARFKNRDGLILYTPMKHTWKNGRCEYCGASKELYDRGSKAETYAYNFIHIDNPEKFFPNMTFDVIIGNPPYQLSFGLEGGNSSNARNIYNLFIEQAIALQPKYLVMITPSRWMTKSAQGIPEAWCDKMLKCNQFKVMHDFIDPNDCFPGVKIMGGVNYFLWDKLYQGKCDYFLHMPNEKDVIHRNDYLNSLGSGVLIRDPEAISILSKIREVHGEYYKNEMNNFSGLVSPKHFYDDSVSLTSNWSGFKNNESALYNIKYYLNKTNYKSEFGWVALNQIPKHHETITLNKVFIPAACGSLEQVLGKPFYGEPNSICSQTYLVIGYEHNLTKEQCLNIISYIKTRFFRYLVSIKKKTQNGPRGVYQFVPLQDFSQPWTDEKLYAKYNLRENEIAYIEGMIKSME